jgi:hypothetical protein
VAAPPRDAHLCVAEDGRQEGQRHDAEGAHFVALERLRFQQASALSHDNEQRGCRQLAHQHQGGHRQQVDGHLVQHQHHAVA